MAPHRPLSSLLLLGISTLALGLVATASSAAGSASSGSSSPHVGEPLKPSNAEQKALSEHLRRRGAVFYGAWWCPACFQQKNLFGKEAGNRLPYVEISKIQRDYHKDPHAAIATLREAVEGQEWQVNDAAYLMFRLAEVYDESLGDRTSAAAIMQQVADQFPETRHSANARHKLHEWGLA